MQHEVLSEMKATMKQNPYGVLPALAAAAPVVAPALPYILPAALGAGAVWYFMSSSGEPKRATPLGSLFSGPVLIGAGGGYAVAAGLKADPGTRIAASLLGMGVGWTVQHYVIAPKTYEQAYEQEKKEEAAAYRWYKPWTW